jgi:predicted phage terminase large subunit-like protein
VPLTETQVDEDISRLVVGSGDDEWDVDLFDVDKATRSLKEFVRQAWHVIEPAELIWGWHMDAICEHLEAQTRGQIRNLIINVPPRTSKTSLVSVMWPAWEWASRPERRFLFSSYTASLSLEIAVQMRRVVESTWYRQFFPRVRLAPDQKSKSKFDTTAKGYRLSTSTGGTVTGKGADCLIIDDPHSTKTIESKLQRETVIEWYRRTFSNRGNDARTVTKTIVMQRQHPADLSGVLLADGGWEHLCLPTEFESSRRCVTSLGVADRRDEEGELLQPSRFGPEELRLAKIDMGDAFVAQHQQRPEGAGGTIFKLKDFRRWRFTGWRGIQLAPEDTFGRSIPLIPPAGEGGADWLAYFDALCWSWDFAFKGEHDSDFVVGQLWARLGPDMFLLHQERGRHDFPECLALMQQTASLYPGVITKYVEEAANGTAIVAMLRHKLSGLELVNVQAKSKEARARAVAPFVRAGNIFVPEDGTSWGEHSSVNQFLAELCAFPRGDYDDSVDSASMAWLKLGLHQDEAPGYGGITKASVPWGRRR